MGQHYYYLFTVWKEPEHELLLQRKTAKACKEYFQLGDRWDYFREKIECGREPGYSLIKEKSSDLARANRPMKGEDLYGYTNHMIWGEGGDVFITNGFDEVKLLCGACKYWLKNTSRSKDGRLYGYCNRINAETERCTWCMAKENAV